jgi:multiple sugar transport system permease protein
MGANEMDYETIERRTALRERTRKTVTYALLTLWAILVLFPFY